MILKRAHIKNFRSIRDCEVEFGEHTAIVGGNGAGKSSILRAIERFYSQSNQISIEDFFGGSTKDPIEIELTFTDLNAAEIEQFEPRLHNGELSVVRIFDTSAGKQSGKYFGKRLQHPPFAAIRNVAGANEKREAYKAIREAPDYNSLPAVTSAAQIDGHLQAWESAHPDRMQLTLDDGQFLGFTNVGRGSLQRHTKFVFIPAVREASMDAQDGKGAVIAELMELVVRSAIEKRAEIRTFQAEVTSRYKEMTSPEKLTELGDLSESLTTTLQRLYIDAAVKLSWREAAELAMPLPLADVLLEDDGFEGPVDRKGHGLQRALILTLLQHLAHASASSQHQNEAEQDALSAHAADDAVESMAQLEADIASSVPEAKPPQPEAFVLPSLILAVEEPELYQHPTKQRHFAKVLHDLSVGTLPGVAAQTQVMFASHSSLFISPERFDEIRLARRQAIEGALSKECVLSFSTLETICRRQEQAFAEAEGSRSVEGLRSRLHVIGPEIAEGFFADVAVLVEGPSDRAALVAAAEIAGANFEENGVAILIAGGKTQIVNPLLIFRELKIPTYFMWDCDKGKKDDHVEYNHALQRLSGIEQPADYAQIVGASSACHERDLETVIRRELGEALYDKLLEDAAETFGLEGRKGVSKSPAAMRDVLTKAKAQGHTSSTLDAIVKSVLRARQIVRAQNTPAEQAAA